MATAVNFQSRLKKLNGAWESAKQTANDMPSFAEVPDGRYVCKLTGAEIGESAGGRLQVGWVWKIVDNDSEYRGQDLRDYDGLETEENLVWLQKKLERLNYEVDDLNIEELPELLKELVSQGITARIRAKTKGEFQNLLIDRVLEDYDAEPLAEEDAPKGKAKSKPAKADDDDEDEEEVAAPKKSSKKEAAAPAKSAKKTPAPPADEYDDEDENEAPAPPKKAKKETPAPAAPAKKSKEKAAPAPKAPAASFEDGQKVSFVHKGKETVGIIQDIDEDEETASVMPEGSKKAIVLEYDEMTLVAADGDEDAEETSDDNADEAVEPQVGMTVQWKEGKKSKIGTITKIISDTELKVKLPDGSKVNLDLEDTEVEIVEEDE